MQACRRVDVQLANSEVYKLKSEGTRIRWYRKVGYLMVKGRGDTPSFNDQPAKQGSERHSTCTFTLTAHNRCTVQAWQHGSMYTYRQSLNHGLPSSGPERKRYGVLAARGAVCLSHASRAPSMRLATHDHLSMSVPVRWRSGVRYSDTAPIAPDMFGGA